MTSALHLIVGPQRHGVTRHAQRIADACGHRSVRIEAVTPDALAALDLRGAEVVHVPFTDRLFAVTAERSAEAFAQLAAHVRGLGAQLSVTLHDLPRGSDALQVRRRQTYAAVVRLSRGVVVSAWHELAALDDLDTDGIHSLQVIGLPVERVPGPAVRPTGRDVVVLGFVYPDRGYDTVVEALPPGARLLALGEASAGHEDLPDELARRASALGREWLCTGFVPDEELRRRARTAAVPIAPNPRPSASASIGEWLAHGRRPLVASSDLARELDEAWPGCIVQYDPADRARLQDLIEQRLDDPSLTVLADGIAIGPALADVALRYAQHLDACGPPAALPVDGRVLLPGNRWDLGGREGAGRRHPLISVVIPYFRDQPRLDLVLGALARQTYPADRLEVVVADDGSPQRPDVAAAAGLAVRVVRQADQGFRAAAARNLGAAAADGEVLAFLDGDTVPEPEYLARLTRLPSIAPDVVAVGRRRHADLTGWSTPRVARWLDGAGEAPVELPEPAWLRDAYARSGDLLAVDARSYRFVISAVMALSRELFDAVGGFDERFVGYGGEDWELANRLYHAGAVLAHARDAVAWHDGAQWAEREVPDRRQAKNAETALLAQLVPDGAARGGGSWAPYPEVVVTLSAADGAGDLAAVLATVRTGLASGVDCAFWLSGPGSPALAARLADPRVTAGPPPEDVLARARVQVQLRAGADLRALPALCAATDRVGVIATPAGRVLAARAANRAARWAAAAGTAPEALLLRLFGGSSDRRLAPWPTDLDLAAVLAGLARPRP